MSAALTAILLSSWLFLMLHTETPREIAKVLFGVITGCSVLYCCLSGIRSTADCLSEEKREGTLGLLFLTDLRGYDVVLGKLAANSVSAFYIIVAVLPVFGIPLLLGGISPAEFGRMALVALNSLFLSLSIGMWISSISQVAQKAMGASLGALLFIMAGLPALGAWLAASYRIPRNVSELFFLSSPGFAYYTAWDVIYLRAAHSFWISLIVIHVLAWLLLGLASVTIPRVWQDRPSGSKKLRWITFWQNWTQGGPASRSAFRKRLLDRNPFFWLGSRFRLRPALLWATLAFLACGWLWGFAHFKNDWLATENYMCTGVILNVLLKGWFASEAVRQFADDRRNGSLELLLSTPLTIADVIKGHKLSLARQFLGPVLLTVSLAFVFILTPAHKFSDHEDKVVWAVFWMAALLMFFSDLAALFWVGIWQGLSARNANRAVSATLGRIWLLPWLIFALFCVVLAIGSALGIHEPKWTIGLGFFVAMSLAVDLWFGLRARHLVLTRFRVVASQRFKQRQSWWKKSNEPV
jgi:ABC-type transport system involved in cytochrome c biogenesis permease component